MNPVDVVVWLAFIVMGLVVVFIAVFLVGMMLYREPSLKDLRRGGVKGADRRKISRGQH